MAAPLAADLTPTDRSLEIGALRGVVAYRWLTIGWAAVALFFQRDHLGRAGLAIATLVVAGAFTVWSTLAARNDAGWLMRPSRWRPRRGSAPGSSWSMASSGADWISSTKPGDSRSRGRGLTLRSSPPL